MFFWDPWPIKCKTREFSDPLTSECHQFFLLGPMTYWLLTVEWHHNVFATHDPINLNLPTHGPSDLPHIFRPMTHICQNLAPLSLKYTTSVTPVTWPRCSQTLFHDPFVVDSEWPMTLASLRVFVFCIVQHHWLLRIVQIVTNHNCYLGGCPPVSFMLGLYVFCCWSIVYPELTKTQPKL